MSAYPRSGQDMLRVAFPHKTDGVGGHVVTATSALGGAALLGLRIVCDPAMLYNGRLQHGANVVRAAATALVAQGPLWRAHRDQGPSGGPSPCSITGDRLS